MFLCGKLQNNPEINYRAKLTDIFVDQKVQYL